MFVHRPVSLSMKVCIRRRRHGRPLRVAFITILLNSAARPSDGAIRVHFGLINGRTVPRPHKQKSRRRGQMLEPCACTWRLTSHHMATLREGERLPAPLCNLRFEVKFIPDSYCASHRMLSRPPALSFLLAIRHCALFFFFFAPLFPPSAAIRT